MRIHIALDEEIVAEVDRRVGRGKRSAFIVESVKRALDDRTRWDLILAALGTIPDEGHEWDANPAAWVGSQRSDDPRRVG